MGKNNLANFFIVFLLIFYKYLLMWNRTSDIYLIIILIIIVIASILVLINKQYNKKILKKILLIFAFFAITTYVSGTIDIIVALLFALLFYDINDGDEKFVKYFTISSSIFFVITIILYAVGILDSTSSQRLVEGIVVGRNSLGFIHVNSVFMYFMPIILGYLYIKKEKTNFKYMITIDIISIILYHFTLCRTGFVLVIILNILIIFKKYLYNNKLYKIIIKNSYVIFTVISLLIAFNCGYNFNSNSLNSLLSFRPYYILTAYNNYGINLLGFGESSYALIDNGYITILIQYGFISFAFYTFFHMKTFHRFLKNENSLIVLSVFMLYMLIENNFVYCNNFILSLQLIFYLNEGIPNENK